MGYENIPDKILTPEGEELEIPARGSLGLLALGAIGLKAWRKKRGNISPAKKIDPKEVITIVSGLPRSGTSLMMQMMANGGMDVLTDNKRKADDSNPKGYYEYEAVKNLQKDRKWVPKAKGKVVKVIAQLLQFLPDQFHYRIIFMQRDLDEILKSQQVMIGKEKEVKEDYPEEIAEAFKRQVKLTKELIEARPNLEVVYIDYGDLLENTDKNLDAILSFLNKKLDKKAMAKSIDPTLYRNKKPSWNK